MLTVAVASLIGSAGVCFLAGSALIAPRDSLLRTKRSITLLVFAVLSLAVLPPQLVSFDAPAALSAVSVPAASVGAALAWPSALPRGLYIGMWLFTSIGSALVGAQIWRARQPGWRGGVASAHDTSAAGRAAGLIPLADSLQDALDVLARTSVDARSVERLADLLTGVGRRFSADVPQEPGAAYRLVAAQLSPAVAAVVTRFLMEGAREARTRDG